MEKHEKLLIVSYEKALHEQYQESKARRPFRPYKKFIRKVGGSPGAAGINEGGRHDMKMLTCKCGQTLPYNHYYHCYNCSCGKCYNAAGSELAPLDEWREEYDQEEEY